MKRIPNDVVRRLPSYLRKLDDLYEKGERTISSGQLCRALGMEPHQFRQDISLFGDYQSKNLYYDVDVMRHEIGRILGTEVEFSAILIGTGKLGSLLLEHFEFIVEGYDFQAAFDKSAEMIGQTINGVPVYDIAELGTYLQEHKTDIAILTVPRMVAQELADILVNNGVEAIWNFTNVDLEVGGADVLVENVHFSDSLLTLNYYLAKKRAGEGNA